ncbi:class I SAM-dependent methyltransferase [Cytobacillus spongiae]|uniref:class I SAM-dependent methyltransferase n=1 Tax=Cytobacillus spongiae TaxID=2901381 RepID=UPI001F46AA21|nr:class I SAM-dependent methyltransferase [Cytobacillus spongiae]UII54180.1 class I SAM-dependent methyltransferase [Cytobacillus spongiae]
MDKRILNYDDLLQMLDDLLRDPKEFWDDFYLDRTKEVPFFKNMNPDENLVAYFENDFSPKKVLELGCGPGRNAIYMAKHGCQVDALDISENAINWAKERAYEQNVHIQFHCQSMFDFVFEPQSYDFIYDCGLFHHLPPHRRLTYIAFLKKALQKDGYFGLVCFNEDGADYTPDWEIYKNRSLNGGIGYNEERLKEIFHNVFDILEFRKMNRTSFDAQTFGEDFLWVSLMRLIEK